MDDENYSEDPKQLELFPEEFEEGRGVIIWGLVVAGLWFIGLLAYFIWPFIQKFFTR